MLTEDEVSKPCVGSSISSVNLCRCAVFICNGTIKILLEELDLATRI